MTVHTFQQISPHGYWLSPDSTTDRPILGIVAGTRGSLVVDAGNSPAHARLLLRHLSAHKLAPPAFVMLTHWHWDHVFGTSALDLPTIAHHETARIVKRMAQLDWSDAALDRRVAEGQEIAFCRDMIRAELPDRASLTIRPPEIAFTSQLSLDLGEVTCQIVHIGGDHAHDSSIVYVPEDRILLLGDCIYDDIYHGPRRLTTSQLFPLLDRLLAYDAAWYLAAHHPEPLARADFAIEAQLLKTIGEAVTTAHHDRDTILARLAGLLGTSLNGDHGEIVEAFLAGLHLPVVSSVL